MDAAVAGSLGHGGVRDRGRVRGDLRVPRSLLGPGDGRLHQGPAEAALGRLQARVGEEEIRAGDLRVRPALGEIIHGGDHTPPRARRLPVPGPGVLPLSPIAACVILATLSERLLCLGSGRPSS